MTDFNAALRHYCRNPKCRTKLKQPVANLHKAFCSRGCHDSFHLKRCVVCEAEKPPRSTARRKLCRRPKCEARYRQNRGLYAFPGAGTGHTENAVRNLDKSGVQTGTFGDRPPSGSAHASWRIVAGPGLTPSQLHCATVPDGPNCEWSGGEYERIEAKNRAALKQVEEFIEWREVISPDGVRCFVARCREVIARVDGVPSDWRPCAPRNPVLDDLSIPDFLKR
jgi:hypothetical protein